MARLLSTFILTLLLASFTHAQDTTKTTWEGAINAGGTKLRFEIETTRVGDKLTGKFKSVDQGNATFDIAKATLGDELKFSLPQLGAEFSGKYNESKMTAKGMFKQSGAKLPLTLTHGEWEATTVKSAPAVEEKLKEAWVGKLELGIMKAVMQFRIMESDDKPIAYFDSITEGRTGFKADWSVKNGKLTFKVNPIKLKFEGKINEAGDEAEGIWSQGGREIPLTLKKQANEYDNVNIWENRPQRPIAPFPYDAEEVKFENKIDKLTLAATLTIPKKPGKHPVVVLISGSGAQDRDETLMEHKPFLVLADYLTRRGIAVLRYDDRGTAESTGDYASATTRDLANDASAAVDFLKSHNRINAKEIGLAGHSEGGLIAPIVCEQRDDIAFVVLLAATGVDGVSIVTSQSAAMLKAEKPAPKDQKEVEISLKINGLVLNQLINGISLDAPEFRKQIDELINQLPESDQELAKKNIETELKSSEKRFQGVWLKYFLKYDPRPALKKIKCPVLAIVGSKDLQVLPDLNMPEIEKALKESGNKDFETEILADLNHLFQKCETGAMSEYATIQETFNPDALDKVGDWIVKRVTRAN
ncbi:MAG: alpha/beta hydrolase family protein [Mariniblastus sp.]